jgi:hypothetical protein
MVSEYANRKDRGKLLIYLRCRMPESPRYQAQVQGRAERAASQVAGSG